jgi:hypothetical protein
MATMINRFGASSGSPKDSEYRDMPLLSIGRGFMAEGAHRGFRIDALGIRGSDEPGAEERDIVLQ